MAMRLDDQIAVRVAGPLRAELAAAAKETGEELSATVQRVLVNWAAGRVVERERGAAEAA